MRVIHPLRPLTPAEARTLQRTAKASSERLDVVKRAQALLAVNAGKGSTQAAQAAGYTSGDSISQVVERFNQHGLAALHIAAGRGRKVTDTPAQRERMIQEVRREPDRKADGTATWSLKTLERSVGKEALPRVGKSTIREVREARRLSLRQNADLVSHWHRRAQAQSRDGDRRRPQSPRKKSLIERAYEQAEAAGIVQVNEDEAGPYQAIPQPGEAWHLEGHPKAQPHEYVRGGTAKLLTDRQ
jgi:hypothetical protein